MKIEQTPSGQYVPPRVVIMAFSTRSHILQGSNVSGWNTGSDNGTGDDMDEGGW